jgi:hypothetical protein
MIALAPGIAALLHLVATNIEQGLPAPAMVAVHNFVTPQLALYLGGSYDRDVDTYGDAARWAEALDLPPKYSTVRASRTRSGEREYGDWNSSFKVIGYRSAKCRCACHGTMGCTAVPA